MMCIICLKSTGHPISTGQKKKNSGTMASKKTESLMRKIRMLRISWIRTQLRVLNSSQRCPRKTTHVYRSLLEKL